MSYRVSIQLNNPTGFNQRIVVEEGTIFEVRDVTSRPSQTLSVTNPVEFELSPGETSTFDLDTECQNPSLRAPRNDPMRLTPFLL